MGKKSRVLYCQEVPATYEERLIAYMRLKKSELAKMLATRDMLDERLRKMENGEALASYEYASPVFPK